VVLQNIKFRQGQTGSAEHFSGNTTISTNMATTLRMDPNRIPKQVLPCKPIGRRNTGCPKKRWKEQLHLGG